MFDFCLVDADKWILPPLGGNVGSHRGNIGVTLVPRWGHIGPPWGNIGRQNFHCIDNVVFVWGFFLGRGEAYLLG